MTTEGYTFANSIYSPRRFNHYNVSLGIPWQQEMKLLPIVYKYQKPVNHLSALLKHSMATTNDNIAKRL